MEEFEFNCFRGLRVLPGRLDACVSYNMSQSKDIFQPKILSSNLKSIWAVGFHYNSNF